MPATGIGRVTYSAKSRTVLRFTYDHEVKLAYLNVAGDVEISMSLSADQLDALLKEGAKVLARMMDDPAAIGFDAMQESQTRSIDRLAHLIARDGK